MFLIEKDAELTIERIGKIIQQFQTKDIPRLNKYYNYYKGKQAITRKKPTDVGKPCNKIVCNYCSGIVSTYSGYMTGVDIDYQSQENFEPVQAILNYNDVHAVDTELLQDALIFGRACELNYLDEHAQQRFKVIDPRECIPVYDDTVNQNLIYGIRFYRADYVNNSTEDYFVEVYDTIM